MGHSNSSGIGSSEDEGKKGGFSFFPLAEASLEGGVGKEKEKS